MTQKPDEPQREGDTGDARRGSVTGHLHEMPAMYRGVPRERPPWRRVAALIEMDLHCRAHPPEEDGRNLRDPPSDRHRRQQIAACPYARAAGRGRCVVDTPREVMHTLQWLSARSVQQSAIGAAERKVIRYPSPAGAAQVMTSKARVKSDAARTAAAAIGESRGRPQSWCDLNERRVRAAIADGKTTRTQAGWRVAHRRGGPVRATTDDRDKAVPAGYIIISTPPSTRRKSTSWPSRRDWRPF